MLLDALILALSLPVPGTLYAAYFLVADGELALCLLVRIGEGLKSLDRLALRDRRGELDISLRVFVAGLQKCV